MRYCATSVMMPELSLEEQADLLHSLRYDGIEWRVRRVTDSQRGQGFSEWGEHKNDLTPENFLEQAPRMKQVAADRGLAIAGIASNAPATDLEQVKLLAVGAQACGAPFIRIGCPTGYDGSQDYNGLYEEAVPGYEAALDVLEGTGVRAALEIHANTIHPSASLAYRIVSHWDPSRVCVIFDANNMVREGFETTEIALELLGPYVGHVHVGGHRPLARGADDAGTTIWEWEGCPLAEGLYDYPRLLRKLQAMDYRGFISVEDFRRAPLEDKLRHGIDYLRRIES
ncbi:MAG: sugar phosphate isomerase/epimerase [Candidatus Eisenbacteria bacterium]|nr:sugar phosphate isomerase/epimerase [Candidatus Eisenbacteria bacterium]